MTNYASTNEWELSIVFSNAFAAEDWVTCHAIKQEIQKRIENNTIDRSLMNGLRYWNPVTQQYEGKPKLDDFNGLFDGYDWAE